MIIYPSNNVCQIFDFKILLNFFHDGNPCKKRDLCSFPFLERKKPGTNLLKQASKDSEFDNFSHFSIPAFGVELMKKRTLAQKKRTLKDLNAAREQAGLKKYEGETRICLKCSRPFFSLGSWNRVCEGCTSVINKRDEPAETYSINR